MDKECSDSTHIILCNFTAMRELSAVHKYFWKYRWRFTLGIFFILLTNYCRILSPQLTGYIVNTVVESLHQPHSKTAISSLHPAKGYDWMVSYLIQFFSSLPYKSKILYTGLMLFVIAIISGFFMFLMRQTIIVMSRLIEYDQKNEIYAHYQQLDVAFYKTHSTGDLMNRITEDVSRVRMYTGPAIMYFVNLAAVIGCSVFFMLRSDVKLTLVALSPLPILAFTIYFVNNIINHKSEQIQSLLSDLTSNAQETFSGIRVIKSFVQEKAMLHFFRKNSEQYRAHALNLAKTESIYFPSMGLMIGLSTLITIMVGSIDVVQQVPGASVGKIAEFVMYIQLLTFPVSAIGWTASMTQRAIASQKRINEFLQTKSTIQDRQPSFTPAVLGNITIEKVDFTYQHTGIHAIQEVSLNISKGEKVAIVGKTGSGKSTLAQLLLKMHPVQKGSIVFNQQSHEQIPAQWIRKKISYVPQDVFLFSDTIENNIRFGNTEASEADIIRAAENACVYHEIMSFPQGFQTMIGERGVMLSGGQKQRISIARALLKDAEIIILDDCLSAVDNKTSQAILHHLTSYLSNKTAILITHRITNLFHFDQIVVLDEGKLVEKGTHLALLAQKGHYFDMYNQQMQESPDSQNTPENP